MFSYDVNSVKTWLIVKEERLMEAEKLFQDTGVNITVEGMRPLGEAIGKKDFVRLYVEEQVENGFFKLNGWQQLLEQIHMQRTLLSDMACRVDGQTCKNCPGYWRTIPAAGRQNTTKLYSIVDGAGSSWGS